MQRLDQESDQLEPELDMFGSISEPLAIIIYLPSTRSDDCTWNTTMPVFCGEKGVCIKIRYTQEEKKHLGIKGAPKNHASPNAHFDSFDSPESSTFSS